MECKEISDGQIKYIVLSIMINAMANRALRLDVAPSKILGVYHNHKSSFCQVLQNAPHFYGAHQKRGIVMQSERPDSNRRLAFTAHALSRVERRSGIAAAADCGARRKN